MGKLQNTFSWSHSAASDFELCRRKRYWSKYAAWGGWERNAGAECRTAYRLNKMDNRFSVQGTVAEAAVLWMLRQQQAGLPVTEAAAWEQVAKGMLRQCWDASTGKAWARHPKACCLHEHYYPDLHDLSEREMMVQVADNVKACLKNFREDVLPRLADVRPEMEVPITVVGQGDPEHFVFEGVKIYAIPDYVFRRGETRHGETWHIWDWKSGRAKPEHAEQVALYALWAKVKHGIPPERVLLSLEYLQSGEHLELAVTNADLERVVERIRDSVQDMSQYLVAADTARNQAMPKAEWDLCFDPALCRRCAFYELCAPELAGLLEEEPLNDPEVD